MNPSPPGSDKEHFRYLDSLRGWAALGVILVHTTLLSHQTGILFNLGTSGQRGVQLFYVISAFTLCHSLEIRPHLEKRPLLNYFIRRFFRIAPLFYLAVIGNLLLNGLAPRPDAPAGLTPFQIVLGFVFLNGFDPDAINSVAMGGWSIAVETTFYVVLPILLVFIKNRRQALLLLIVTTLVAFPISHFFFQLFRNPDWSEYFYFFWFPIQFPIFCLGVATYFFWKHHFRDLDFFGYRRRLSLVLVLVAMLVFYVGIPVSDANLCVTSSAFVALLLGLSLWEWKLFVNPITVFIGRISYSIYLVQFFWLGAVDRIFHDFESSQYGTMTGLFLAFLVLLILTVSVSILTHFIIEKPGIRLGRALIQYHESRPIPARI